MHTLEIRLCHVTPDIRKRMYRSYRTQTLTHVHAQALSLSSRSFFPPPAMSQGMHISTCACTCLHTCMFSCKPSCLHEQACAHVRRRERTSAGVRVSSMACRVRWKAGPAGGVGRGDSHAQSRLTSASTPARCNRDARYCSGKSGASPVELGSTPM